VTLGSGKSPQPLSRLATRCRHAWRALPWKRERARARLHRLLHPSAPPRRQIVICGFPRSGTSLLYNMLAVALPHFGRDPFEASALTSIWRFEDRLSKLPLDVFRLEELVSRNEHGKRLHVLAPLRDPRDLVTSVHPNVPDAYFIGWDTSYRVGLGEAGAPEPMMPGIGAIEAALQAIARHPGLEVLRFRYEDLVRDPGSVERWLAERLGLAFRARFVDFHLERERLPYRYDATHLRPDADRRMVREDRPLDATRAGKWRAPEHRERIRDQFGRHPELLALVRDWGYEPDDTWFEPYRGATDSAIEVFGSAANGRLMR
jgi:hypothetical protein